MTKKIRYYYWLIRAFLRKNARFMIISGIGSFFLIFLIINFYPVINATLFTKKEVIGIVGEYQVQAPPTEIAAHISNPLIEINEKGQIVPLLIDSWSISKDEKTYRFLLKKNLYWSDKKPFTARDISYKFTGITMKVIDDTTIEFQLSQKLATFPIYLTRPLIKYPLIGIAGVYDRQSYKASKGNITEISLIPNKKDLPTITYKMYTNDDALVNAYKRGEIRSFKTSRKSVADTFTTWKNSNVTPSIDYSQIMTLFYNTKAGILEDTDFRRALNYAIPPEKVNGQPASGPIPPTSWAYYSKLKRYAYDPEKAQGIIDKKSASQSATLSLTTFYEYINVAEELKKNFEAVGVKVNLKVLSYIPDDFELLLTAWSPPQDPDQYFFWHSTQQEGNITKLKNVKIDKELEDGRKFIKVAQRKAVYQQFQKTLVDEAPANFLYYPYQYEVTRK